MRAKKKRGRKRWFVLGAAVGYEIAYLMDPDKGRGRRARLRDQIEALMRRVGREAGRKSRYTLSNIQGEAERMAYERKGPVVLDDETLKDKVESELFAPADVPKGDINVDVAGGVVTLRGEVETDELMLRLERAASNIDGVADVECLLHLPGTPAPNKVSARRAATAARTASF